MIKPDKQVIEIIAQAFYLARFKLNISSCALENWLEAERWVIAEVGSKKFKYHETDSDNNLVDT